MSSAGAGFPHAFLGTSRPADIWIGTVEAKVLWGRLDCSDYLPNPTHPLLTALVVDYTPRWLPRLSVGLSRVQLQVWEDLRFQDWFPFLQSFEKKNLKSLYDDPTGDNPNDNQLASVFGRWVFPASGLEIFFEWAREDHENSWEMLIREPDHTQAYTLGLQKVFRRGDRWVRLHGEYTDLQEFRPASSVRGNPTYYLHGRDLSYTYQGQLLGAWIGPGADSQILAVDVFNRKGRIGGYLERVRRNEVVYWEVIDPQQLDISHDTEVTAAVRQVFFAGPVDVSWEAGASYRWNRDFFRDEPNFRVSVGVGVPMGRGRVGAGAGAAQCDADRAAPDPRPRHCSWNAPERLLDRERLRPEERRGAVDARGRRGAGAGRGASRRRSSPGRSRPRGRTGARRARANSTRSSTVAPLVCSTPR